MQTGCEVTGRRDSAEPSGTRGLDDVRAGSESKSCGKRIIIREECGLPAGGRICDRTGCVCVCWIVLFSSSAQMVQEALQMWVEIICFTWLSAQT